MHIDDRKALRIHSLTHTANTAHTYNFDILRTNYSHAHNNTHCQPTTKSRTTTTTTATAPKIRLMILRMLFLRLPKSLRRCDWIAVLNNRPNQNVIWARMTLLLLHRFYYVSVFVFCFTRTYTHTKNHYDTFFLANANNSWSQNILLNWYAQWLVNEVSYLNTNSIFPYH